MNYNCNHETCPIGFRLTSHEIKLEASLLNLQRQLDNQAEQRKEQREEVKELFQQLLLSSEHMKDELVNHMIKEEAERLEIHTILKTLVDATDDNTDFITKVRKRWIWLTGASVAVTSIIAGLYWLHGEGYLILAIGLD